MDATAIDILDHLPPLPLTDYNRVRIPQGKSDWVDFSIRDGKITVMASRGLVVRLSVANSFEIEIAR